MQMLSLGGSGGLAAVASVWTRIGDIVPHNTLSKQRLHLVFGGELTELDGHEFRDINHLEIIGIFPDYATAHAAWQAAAHRTVDNAMMRYVIVHLHRLLEPDEEERQHRGDKV